MDEIMVLLQIYFNYLVKNLFLMAIIMLVMEKSNYLHLNLHN